MRIAVDFDQTLWDRHRGGIIEGAADAMRRLKDDGHELIIWTARPDYTTFEIGKLLEAEGVPFDFILGGKLHYDVLIDDKARQFDGWEKGYL